MAVRVTIAGDEIEPEAPVRLFDAAISGGFVPGDANTRAFWRDTTSPRMASGFS